MMACITSSHSTHQLQLLRGVLALSIALVAITAESELAASRAQRRTFDLRHASVDDIQVAVGAGALTYERLVQLYLERIRRYDKSGPRLNAMIHINPRATELARELDEERRSRGLRSALHGIPIAVKDNVDTRDMPTTGGNIVFANSHPPRDAFVIDRLREAGAIIFLKTNLDEFALGTQGLSSLGGQTLNPYNLQRSPGGSSGGTAAAIAAGFATAGITTETGVSTRTPAANTFLVGLVPTRGLVSRSGVMPITFTQDRIGVHATSVRDAALVMSRLVGFDAEDLSTTALLDDPGPRSYESVIDTASTGARIGVLRDLFRPGNEFAEANRMVVDALRRFRTHVELVDDLTTGMPLLEQIPALRVNNYELRFAFDAYLKRRGPSSPVRTFAELIATGKYLKQLDSRYGPAMKVSSLDGDEEYFRRRARQRAVRDALIALMDRERLDVLAYPVKSVGAAPVGQEDKGLGDNPISSIAGLPAIALPVGLNAEGLPLAVEFLARPFAESQLLRVAAMFERQRGARVLPPTTPSLPGERFEY